jgi:DNA-binding winged helix-turn-helix (wHTH) protein/TolB-like protein/Tfp pilus assembly protein PilF
MGTPATRPAVVRFGLYEADLAQRQLTREGSRIKLQDQPFQVLRLLLERPGEVITREEIRQKLWTADTFVEFDDGLNTAIKKLRTALGDSADNPRFIETVPRRGYRFIAPVSPPPAAEQDGPSAAAPSADLVIAAREHQRITIEETAPRPNFAFRYLVAALLAVGVGLGGYLYRVRTRAPKQNAGAPSFIAPAKLRPSIAVLGFRNLTGRRDQAWLSTALSQMFSTELGEGEQLRMISSEQVSRASRDNSWEGSDTLAKDSLTRLRSLLNTDYVALGSYTVVGTGDKAVLRVDVRLQDAVAGETIAESSVTGNESDLFALVDKAGAQMRQRLGVNGLASEQVAHAKAASPANAEADHYYAEGLARLRVQDAPGARDLFLKGIAADPEHALSHAALAEAWRGLGYDDKARDEAKLAVDLSSSLSRENRLSIEGRYREFTHEWPKAAEIYTSLRTFFPDNLEYQLLLARAQIKAGRPKDALDTVAGMRTLPALESNDPRIDLAESTAAEGVNDFRRSEEAAEAAERKADALRSRLLKADAKAREAWAWNRLGDVQKSVAAYTAAHELSQSAGNPRDAASDMSGIGQLLYYKGDLVGAENAFQTAVSEFRKIDARWDLASSLHNLSMVFIDQGRLLVAKQNLEEALRIQRELEDVRGVSSDLDDLSTVLADLGQLDAAAKMKDESVAGFQQTKYRMGEAITLTNYGVLLMAKGQPKDAEDKLERALEIKQQISYKQGIAYTQSALADAELAQDRIREASNNAEQALAIRTQLQSENQAANSQVQIANLLIEQGKAAEAEQRINQVKGNFAKNHDATDGVIAEVVLARALLAQKKTQEAVAAAQRATALAAQSEDLNPRFLARIVSAQAQDASGKTSEALRALETIRADAHRYGFVGYELDARLNAAEIETRTHSAQGRGHAAQLEKDAREHGLLLVARKAAELEK